MANHKRKRAKKQRAGCLMCKPHKMNGQKKLDRNREQLRLRVEDRELSRYGR